MTLGLT